MDEFFRIERPATQTIPVVVDVPHAGEWIPDEVRDEITVEGRSLKRDLDLYVDRIWEETPKFGATLISSKVSRYVIDLNRAADDVSPQTVEGGRRKNRPGYYQDRGVVWRNSTDGTPLIEGPMPREVFERRIELFHAPYHSAIAAEIERVREAFGYCILVDGHSMPSRGRSAHVDSGKRRADVVPGDAEGTSCDRRIRDLVCEHYRKQSYGVRPNRPYKGGWITRHFGRPHENVHAIQIEVNRDLYMDESTFEIRASGLQRLADVSVALLPRLGRLDL